MPKQGQRSKSPATNKKQDTSGYLKLFEMLGVSFATHSKQSRAEACPFCGGGKFTVNAETGEWQCLSKNKCGEKGNSYVFIRKMYESLLGETTDTDRNRLKSRRSISLQTIKRHGLAYDRTNDCWLIPFKSLEGKVLNLTRYFPNTGMKYSLPMLSLQPYGLDNLRANSSKETLFVFEGPFDAISCDQHLRQNKTRNRYDIIAVPGASTFKDKWLVHLEGRKVRVCFDNDKAGRDGQERIAKLCRENDIKCKITSLAWPVEMSEGYDIGDLIRDNGNVAEFTREHCVATEAAPRLSFRRGDEIQDHATHWFWDKRIPFGQFVSFSGLRGHGKSTVMRDFAARATAGDPMPHCTSRLDAFDVMYFTSEDAGSVVRDIVKLHGGDLERLHIHDIAETNDPVDLLDCLDEMEREIKARGVRLVILDALNSFVSGDISSDAKARRTLSGRLMGLARRTDACIVGIRNWGRMEGGSSSQKSLGATSLSDVARCTMNTNEIDGELQLEFERVSDARLPKPIRYQIDDCSKSNETSHLRRIVWEKGSRKKVAKKGSKRVRPTKRKKASAGNKK